MVVSTTDTCRYIDTCFEELSKLEEVKLSPTLLEAITGCRRKVHNRLQTLSSRSKGIAWGLQFENARLEKEMISLKERNQELGQQLITGQWKCGKLGWIQAELEEEVEKLKERVLEGEKKVTETQLQVELLKQKITEVEEMKIGISCPICLSSYGAPVNPVVGSCGHSLCRICWPRLDNFKNCPICRHPCSFLKPTRNYLVQEVLDQIKAPGSGEQKLEAPEEERDLDIPMVEAPGEEPDLDILMAWEEYTDPFAEAPVPQPFEIEIIRRHLY